MLGIGGADERVVPNLQLQAGQEQAHWVGACIYAASQTTNQKLRHSSRQSSRQGSFTLHTCCRRRRHNHKHPPKLLAPATASSHPSTAACTMPPRPPSSPWAPCPPLPPPAPSSRPTPPCPVPPPHPGPPAAGSAQWRPQQWWGMRCPCAVLQLRMMRVADQAGAGGTLESNSSRRDEPHRPPPAAAHRRSHSTGEW